MSSRDSNGLVVTKLVGTGNDFLFVDAQSTLPGRFAKASRPEIVKLLCDRHFGLGADGMVFVEKNAEGYRWDFFNTDGSYAEMCGNATRCFGRWANSKLGLKEIEFETLVGKVKVTVDKNEVTSYLAFVKAELKELKLPIGTRELTVYLTNTGVPHFVVPVGKLEEAQVASDIIQTLRFHPEAGARGANVTFLEILSAQRFRTVTFERGVEDFTLSCGTGVLAAAAVGLQTGTSSSLEADVSTPGGSLKVKFGPGFSTVSLTGPAVEVFETTLPESVLDQEIPR
jgi:diaminopimelate epimerase